MGFNIFKKKPIRVSQFDTPSDEYENITNLMAIPRSRPLQAQPAHTNKPTDQITIKSIPKVAPKAQDTPAYHHTKDTGTIRFHNDFISKLKDLKGPGVTFEQYLKERLSIP